MRQLVAKLVDDLPGNGRRLCFSVPGAPVGSPDDLTYHESTVRQVLDDMGFQVSSINEGWR